MEFGIPASGSTCSADRNATVIFFCIGVVVFGKEYFFGGGIQAGTPSMTPYGRPVEIVDLGETQIPQGMLFIIDKSRDPFSEW
jgi:hypothetical protein